VGHKVWKVAIIYLMLSKYLLGCNTESKQHLVSRTVRATSGMDPAVIMTHHVVAIEAKPSVDFSLHEQSDAQQCPT
jgi:hypothetical protein